ncbi:MAG: DUF1697 domain-containing protein [Bacteroidales bacterium]|nr:DUF1697 domain-containing protein [Bacteroidales bacterium]
MKSYISFLRGVNMSGHNSIKMTDLAALYNSLGFSEVRTYIQSGNVLFSDNRGISESDIAQLIEKEILNKFSFVVPAMIRSVEELKALLSVNPFLNEKDFDPAKMAVIFLHAKPSDIQIDKVSNINYPPDKFMIKGSEIFIFCPNGFGKTKLYTNFFEKKMGVTGTARNWKTITAILQMV